MDFNNNVHAIVPLFDGYEWWITETTKNTWIVGGLLIIFALIVRVKLKNFKQVPESNFQNIVELIVDSMDKFCMSNMGKANRNFGVYFFGVFSFILCANLSAMFFLRPPTADLATTMCLGLTTFVLIHVMGITRKKAVYWKEFIEPVPLFLPINLISMLAIPMSLSFRLFGNLTGGVIVLGLVYGLLPWFMVVGIPAPLHFYFDLFAGCLQAFIFTILSMTFIKQNIPDPESV